MNRSIYNSSFFFIWRAQTVSAYGQTLDSQLEGCGERDAGFLMRKRSSSVVGFEPARRLKRRAVEAGRQAVLGIEPRGQNIELQRTNDADDPIAAIQRLEDAGHPLLGQLFERVLQVLRLHRVL